MPHDVDHHAILEQLGSRAPFIQRLDPARTAHLIVDMQNGFMEQGAAVEVAAARGVVNEINMISAALRDAGGLNVFLAYTSPEPDDRTWSNFMARLGPAADPHLQAFERNSHFWQLWPELDVSEQDLIVEKIRFSAFVDGSSNLNEILTDRGIDTVIVTGTMTNCCCESTARDAMQLNYRVVFVPDATGASTDDEQAATLYTMGRIFADLRSSNELVDMLAKAPTSA